MIACFAQLRAKSPDFTRVNPKYAEYGRNGHKLNWTLSYFRLGWLCFLIHG
jgi:hypothetical protein